MPCCLALDFLVLTIDRQKMSKKTYRVGLWGTLWYSASARLKLIKRSTPLLRWRHRRLLSSPTANTSTRFPKGPKMAKGFREMVPYSYLLVLCWLFWCCSFFFWGSPKILMILRLEHTWTSAGIWQLDSQRFIRSWKRTAMMAKLHRPHLTGVSCVLLTEDEATSGGYEGTTVCAPASPFHRILPGCRTGSIVVSLVILPLFFWMRQTKSECTPLHT